VKRTLAPTIEAGRVAQGRSSKSIKRRALAVKQIKKMNATLDFRAGKLALAIAIAACLHLPPASAEVLVYEGFDYPPNVGLNGLGQEAFRWQTNRWSQGFATSDWMVFSNGLQFATLPVMGGGIKETNLTQGADYQRLFAPYQLADAQAIWFSFLIRVTQGASWSVYLSSEQNASKIGVQGSYVDYQLRARIGVGDNGSTNAVDLRQNQVRLIVGRYKYLAGANEELDVWLDPAFSTEPVSGGVSTSNHIAYSKELTTDPDRRDRLLISDRSIGALELDEIRVGTTWSDVISHAVDKPIIKSFAPNGAPFLLGVERLTIGTTNYVEATTTLAGQFSWQAVATFVSTANFTNLSLPLITTNGRAFFRIRSE